MPAPVALINGQARSVIDCADRGLAYGDGLFETLVIQAGQPADFNAHRQRLHEGCRRLNLPCPDAEVLLGDIHRLAADRERAVVKIIVTRGLGGRGYRPPVQPTPTRIVSIHDFPDYPADWPDRGVIVRLCRTRLAINPLLAGIKHLNRLEQVLARSEWRAPEIAEGLMCDVEGWLVEGTQTNVFCVRDRMLFTPELDRCGVSGIMRAKVIAAARNLGMRVVECRLALTQLYQADEVFLTNSVIGLWPVRQLVDKALPVGSVSERLRRAVGYRS